jgi:hypothetical protein
MAEATEEERYKSDSYCLILKADGGEERDVVERVSPCCCDQHIISTSFDTRCAASTQVLFKRDEAGEGGFLSPSPNVILSPCLALGLVGVRDQEPAASL